MTGQMGASDETGHPASAADASAAGHDMPAALGGFALFAALDPASRTELARGAHLRKWPAGRLIFSRGDPGDAMLAIVRGRIRLSLSSARGREIVLATLGPGEIIGEMALLDGEPRSADASAVGATTCIVLPRARFEAVAARRPDIGLALARHLCMLLRRTNFQMESVALHDLQTRLVRFLLAHLARAPVPGSGARHRIALDLNQGEIAAILGATRPKVNMAFRALAEAGALQRDGDMLICDRELLSRLAEGAPPRAAAAP